MAFQRRPPRLLALSAAVCAAGAAMVLAAVPTAVSDLAKTPGDSVLRRLQDEETVTEADLESLVRSREASARWRQTASAHTDLAMGRLILGELRDADRRQRQVEDSLREGLVLAPMDPYGWMRLAQVRLNRSAPAAEIAAPLRLSLRSGPHEDRRHAMLLLRVEAGLLVWEELDGPERALIGEKALAAWTRDVSGAAAAATRAGRADVMAHLLGF